MGKIISGQVLANGQVFVSDPALGPGPWGRVEGWVGWGERGRGFRAKAGAGPEQEVAHSQGLALLLTCQ